MSSVQLKASINTNYSEIPASDDSREEDNMKTRGTTHEFEEKLILRRTT